MNSIKNTIVTVTLLAVGYGAYVVLNSPPPDEFADVPASVMDDMSEDAVSVHIPHDGHEADASLAMDQPIDYPVTASPHGFGQQDPGGLDAYDQAPLPTDLSASDVASSLGQDAVPPTTIPDPNAAQAAMAAPDWDSADAPPIDFSQNQAALSDTQPETDTNPPAGSFDAPGIKPPATADTATSPVMVGGPGADPTGNPGFEEAWKAIHSNLANSQLSDALFALTVWYDEPSLSPEQAQRCIRLLDQLAGTVIFSRESFLEPAHVVQQGETLQDLADRYNIAAGFLARINGIAEPYELYPGESLKVVRGPFRAEISRQRNEVTVFLGRYYAGRFKARIGQELPVGPSVYEVIAKESGREFFDRRTGYRVARDDPSNPYGGVWIGLRGDQITAAHNVGIHVDTGRSGAVCVGVSPSDASDLDAILSVGSRVNVKQ